MTTRRPFSPAVALATCVAATWFAPLPASAQDASSDAKCATVRPAYPAELANWSVRAPLSAGRAPRNAPVLSVGRGVDLTLHPLAQVQPVAA